MSERVICAVPVPFASDSRLDRAVFETAMRSISPLVDAVLVAGTTGEFPALDDDERLDLFRWSAEVCGAERVIAHLGHASSRQVVRLAEATAAIGIRRFALLSPYYLPTDSAGVVDFYAALTQAHPEAQVYAYLFPERTGLDIPPEVLAEVLALPGMAGVKLSGGAAARMREYLPVLARGQAVYSGDDSMLPAVLAMGGSGVVSGVSAAFPGSFHELGGVVGSEDPRADVLQSDVVRMVRAAGPTISRLKYAMALRYGGEWSSRMSLPAVSESVRAEIAEAIALNP